MSVTVQRFLFGHNISIYIGEIKFTYIHVPIAIPCRVRNEIYEMIIHFIPVAIYRAWRDLESNKFHHILFLGNYDNMQYKPSYMYFNESQRACSLLRNTNYFISNR